VKPDEEETADVDATTGPDADREAPESPGEGRGNIDAEDAGEEAVDADAAADDLTQIQGIGPKMALRLRKAGVRTFDDLADVSPEEVREIMGGLPSFANVENWIEQADDRADDRDA
jgi:predicted flap endonuclease-1-like 5' DNA nuclease